MTGFAVPVVVALVIAVLALLFVLETVGVIGFTDVATAAATGIAAAALVLAVLQWRVTTAENALVSLWSRIELANRMYVETAGGDDEQAARQAKLQFYIFTEVDTLEYVLLRYRVGTMDLDVANRVFRRFRRLCSVRPEFRRLAVSPEVLGAGYFSFTQSLVERLAREAAGGEPEKP